MKKILSLMLVGGVLLSLAACSSNTENSNSSSDIESSINSTISKKTIVYSDMNFSDIDEAYKQALKDSENATEEDAKVAINWLNDNIDNIYDSNDMMEKTAYYGTLLQKIYPHSGDTMHEIGYEALICVKYVYTGYDKVEDSATQRRYKKLKELLKNV